jgi:hypothetical protein
VGGKFGCEVEMKLTLENPKYRASLERASTRKLFGIVWSIVYVL